MKSPGLCELKSNSERDSHLRIDQRFQKRHCPGKVGIRDDVCCMVGKSRWIVSTIWIWMCVIFVKKRRNDSALSSRTPSFSRRNDPMQRCCLDYLHYVPQKKRPHRLHDILQLISHPGLEQLSDQLFSFQITRDLSRFQQFLALLSCEIGEVSSLLSFCSNLWSFLGKPPANSFVFYAGSHAPSNLIISGVSDE